MELFLLMLAYGRQARIIREMRRPGTFRQSTKLTVVCAAILLGLGWARFCPALRPEFVWLLGFCAALGFRKRGILSLYVLCIFGFSLGWWRGGMYMAHVHELSGLAKQQVTLTGTALIDSVYDGSQISFNVGDLSLQAPYQNKIVGKIGVSGYGAPMVYRGDVVQVSGKFYPARGSLVAYISYADIQVKGTSHSLLYSGARRFTAGLQNALPEPLASFALGLLVGQRNTLPDNVTATLSAVGLTHIIAVSGYNLTIMTRAGKRIFGKRSKFQTYVGCQVLVLGFLLVTGFSASIVRAAIISTLSLGAWYYGRTIKPLLLIVFTAALTAVWNPLYVWTDVGWYLSFMAFFGVLIVAPQIHARFLRRTSASAVGGILKETLSAQLMTLPFILYIFKASSFIALPANLLVVPLIPVAMFLCFLAGLAGMLIAPFAGWISFPARYLLTYLLDIAALLSRVPKMKFTASLSLAAVLYIYVVIIFVLSVLWRKNKLNGKITEIKV